MNEQLLGFIERSRWFGGKGRRFQVTGTRRLGLPGGGEPDPVTGRSVFVELVSLEYADGGGDVYQVPVSYYSAEQIMLHHALVGTWDDPELGHVWAYDALHDHAATPLWLRAFGAGDSSGEVVFHRVGEPDLDTDLRSTLLTGEQSNSSVAFGDQSLMKVFRRLTPGENPDIEILAALTEGGSDHIAALYGWVDAVLDGEVYQLGILQQFLRTASDGWESALASLRGFYADDDISARDAGGDFAGEAYRLGTAVAEMHDALAACFPTATWDSARLHELADAMDARLDAAVDVVPQLAEHRAALAAVFDAVRKIDAPVTVQRVHGDLHLGQTLRTVKNWKIIDFEGEPAKPLSERRSPDSPWRDVAGMLRSFSYAAELSAIDHAEAAGEDAAIAGQRAREWADRNVHAFLAGYREASGSQNHEARVDAVLLAAYTADKAVYEAVYEARNRPAWLSVPLAAIARMAAPSQPTG